MSNLQPANEYKCKDILIAVGNLGQLALKVTGVGLEVVAQSHFDSQEVVVIPLGFPMRGALSEERFDYLEIVERMWRQRVDQSKATLFKLDEKVRHKSKSLWVWIIILS